MTITYSFLYTRKFKEYIFLKGVLIYREKTTHGINYFFRTFDWGVFKGVYISDLH